MTESFILNTVGKRYCPDLDKLGDNLMVKNLYNQIERTSFSIEIVKCNPKVRECDLKNLKPLLKELYFSFFNLEERINFKDE